MYVRTPVLVGRTGELAQAEARIAGARASSGGAVFLVGEAGIGKSRLAAEIASRAARQQMRVTRGRASLLGPAVPFRPLAEALFGLFRAGGPPHADLSPYHRILGRLVPEWQGPDPPQGGDSLVVLAEAMLRVVVHVGDEHGCLLVLEDLHGADAETLTVVEYLVDNLRGQRALLLGTVRTEAGNALDLVRSAGRHGDATVMELGPLSQEEVRLLAGACLDTPAEQVPARVVDRLHLDGGGNPFVIEEMLSDMRSSGALASPAGRWRVVGDLPTRAPLTVVGRIVHRMDRMGEQGHTVFGAAAVLGRRFPLEVVQAVTGLDDQSLLRYLHAGIAAQLVVPDEQSPDWYTFRHALTTEALLAGLGPATRAALAGRCADVIDDRYPGLPGDWCQLVAELRLTAGDPGAAGRLFAEAGRRALADGAASSAVALLDRARDLVTSRTDGQTFADILETLLLALLETGQIDRALAFADTLDVASGGLLQPRRLAAVHTQLAWVAALAGRLAVGTAQVAAARALLGADAGDRDTAPIDAVAAFLEAEAPRADALEVAEELARNAVAAAERVPLPPVACQAWHLLGILARRRGIDEADACFQRIEAIAAEHQLEIWRLRAHSLLAGNDALRHGAVEKLARVRNEAMRVGAIAIGYGLDASLAFQSVLRGEYDNAAEFLDRCWAPAVRLRLNDIVRYLAMTRAALAAHQCRRPAMEQALSDFRQWGGEGSPYLTLTWGLCQAVCALLEEDADGALISLAREEEHAKGNPSYFHLAGRYGLSILLSALRGKIDLVQSSAACEAPPSRLVWNRQFVLLAHATLLGRNGQAEAAAETARQALQVAEVFAMSRHLGMRLVAEAALADGWGDPVVWLRKSEEYFHTVHIAAVASGCRALLRRAGASVGQHRGGQERIPTELRRLGVTTREYDVLELLVDRRGNKEIASRLHLSPRTVEKHVASLIAKTRQVDRAALSAYGATAITRSWCDRHRQPCGSGCTAHSNR